MEEEGLRPRNHVWPVVTERSVVGPEPSLGRMFWKMAGAALEGRAFKKRAPGDPL